MTKRTQAELREQHVQEQIRWIADMEKPGSSWWNATKGADVRAADIQYLHREAKRTGDARLKRLAELYPLTDAMCRRLVEMQ